ncbi:hypothetical protein [Thermococcus sp. 21S7]|uniref:hypothetical protein n=1 Tax=Thermococcus sp. 21S7 TaxID=1638221 RepID=UPI00143A9A26|nr:hypothetical protein [Thermococcus sp. 21S7]NJE60305.1 hypothetical protein [Thermococcus sp. 21S7]
MSAYDLNSIIQKLDEISWSYYFQILAMKSIIKEMSKDSTNEHKNDSPKEEADKTKVNKEKLIQKLIRKAETKSLDYGELYQLYEYLRETDNLDVIQTLPLEIKNELERIHTEQLLMEEAFKPYQEIASALTKIVSPIIEVFAKIRERTEQEKQQIILKSMLIQSIALWESILKDYLRVLLYYDSRPLLVLNKEKMFSIAEIISAEEEYPDIRSMVVEKYVESIFFRKNIDEIDKELSRLHIVQLNQFSQWTNLREAYYRRNLFAHNNGRINKIYCTKLNFNDCPIGKEVELTPEYIEKLLDALGEFLEFIYENNYVVCKLKRNQSGGD